MPGPSPDNLPPDAIRGPSRNRLPAHDRTSAVTDSHSAHTRPEAATTSLDPPEPGMWLTASSWLPAALLDGPAKPGRTPIEAALGQGGPLDTMPPGPVLAAFLAEVSAPASLAPPSTAGSGPNDPGPATTEPDGSGSAGSGSAAQGPGREGHPATPDSLAARIVSGAGLPQLRDNALLGLIRGWRRMASLAAAAELAAVHEFSKRRHDQAKADGAWDSTAMDAADVELAAALTLTNRGTQMLVDRAEMQHDLPATATALAAGQIDWPRALVLFTGLTGQEPELARRLEEQLIGRAPQQTTGQLRAALNRALLAADPEAAERRRQREEEQARIERGPDPGGATALLAGRCLPVPETVTAWNRITVLARQLRAAGAGGTLDQLRVHVYLALLNGQAITAPPGSRGPGHDSSPDPGPAGAPSPDSADSPAASPETPGRPTEIKAGQITGHINLTVPLGTIAGFSDAPGHLGGFGPITGSAARELASGVLGQPGVRWCVTVTNDQGRAVGHGCATRIQPFAWPPGHRRDAAGARTAAPGEPGWQFNVKLTALAAADCSHGRESPHYRPPPSLTHLVQTRNVCCTAPGCRMAASVCDDDHTVPFGQGGRTCECNLGPLCRHHHRVKHARGWRLIQPEPGVFAWNTPSGRFYTTGPTQHVA